MGFKSYLPSLFSLKKIKNKRLSFLSIWDTTTKMTEYTELERFVKLNHVSIGKYSRVDSGGKVTYATLGNFTVLGPNATINLGRHPLNYLTTNSIFYLKGNWAWRSEWVKPLSTDFELMPKIEIGSDVWMGSNVTVMGGVKIGSGAVIATGAVVVKDVPPYAIVGGVPAKVIKYRFPPEIIERLLEIKWWDLPDEEITKHLDLFHKPDITLEDLNEHFGENNRNTIEKND